tara:strand:+ start:4707 stop:6746 length:2040 start_codon:yes stop_codon:yes gene_type:complete
MPFLYAILLMFVTHGLQPNAVMPSDIETYLQKGLNLEQQGEPEQALILWQLAIDELTTPSVAIATEYLRIATQYGLRDYYPTAHETYQWGMSGYNPEAMLINRKPLEEEISRMEPLLEQSVHRHWTQLLEANSPMLLEEMLKYWERLNIRPSTPFNERLIEHWERIAYAREHYSMRSDPPYDTDARGLYYVKYGLADYKETGRVDVTQDKMRWILDQFLPKDPDSNPDYTPTSYELMLVSNAISNLFLNPEYELWIYDSPAEEMSHNLVLIFGHRSGGRFGKLDVLEDFMPGSAFDMSALLREGIQPDRPIIQPGLVLQLIYYEHFYAKDPYFAELHASLTSEVYRGGLNNIPDPLLAGTLRSRNINQTNRLIDQSPDEFSTEEKKIAEIPIQVYQYRLLDSSNRPVLATFVESYPHNAFITDFVQNEEALTTEFLNEAESFDNLFDWYQLIHGLQLRTGQWDLLGQARQFPELLVDPDAEIPSRTSMLIHWNERSDTQVFYAELVNIHPDSEPQMESLFSESLRGLGKVEIEQPQPLALREGELGVRDIILGYNKLDEVPDDLVLFHFTPANTHKIPAGENLVVHFEVYQLQTDPDGFSSFDLDYEIRPRSRLFDWARSQADQFTISLTFENEGDRFVESLEIETIQLEPGNYELTFTIREPASNQTHEQQIEFEVVD